MGLLFKDRWRLTAGNQTKKSFVLQILHHPGDGSGGINLAFLVGQDLNKGLFPERDHHKVGRSYIRALKSFKNVKSLEAAIKTLKHHNPIRIFRGVWTETQLDGKLIYHVIIKKGKTQKNYIELWEKTN